MRRLAGFVVVVAASLFAVAWLRHPNPPLQLQITPTRLPADGYARAALEARAGDRVVPATFTIVQGQHAARITSSRVVAGVLGGPIVVEARANGFAPVRAVLETVVLNDARPDGTPAFLHLDDRSDRAAFTRWFTFLAESQYFAPELPAEIKDCAGLIRFAYREALHTHNGDWAASLQLFDVPAIPSVHKYEYPFTPLGANLFRTSDDDFAEFADVRTLLRYNVHLISRDIQHAAQGDLLFYRQEGRTEPYHTMIFLGHSQFEAGQFEDSRESFVVYHTGHSEMRRPSIAELMHHPAPEWRPVEGNPNFLGVYRWNILRDN